MLFWIWMFENIFYFRMWFIIKSPLWCPWCSDDSAVFTPFPFPLSFTTLPQSSFILSFIWPFYHISSGFQKQTPLMNYCADICRTPTTNLIRMRLIESPCGLHVTHCISMRRASVSVQSARCPIQRQLSIKNDNNHNQPYICLALSICLMLDYYLVVD